MGGYVLPRLAWVAVVVVAVLTKNTTLNSKALKECRKIDVQLGEGDVSIVDSFSLISGNGAYFYTYFYPHPSFKGISVEGFGSRGKTSVWFPLNTGTGCFRRGNFDWWRVDVICTYNKDTQYIWFYMHTSNCLYSCAKRHVTDDLVKIHLVAYGPSKWRRSYPDNPCVTEWLYPAPHQDFCWDPPPYVLEGAANDTDTYLTTNISTDASINLTLVVLASVVAVVVIVVVVGVVVVVKVRARRAERSAACHGDEAGTQAAEQATYTSQVDNVYYDVMDTRRNTEHIYEDIDQRTTMDSYITPLPPTPGGLRRVWMVRDDPPPPFPSCR